MAISLVAVSATVANGSSTTAAVTVGTPALPTGTAAGDRVFILLSNSPGATAPSNPAGWTLIGSTQVGIGTQGASAGPRRVTAWYRDYDGSWSMPSLSIPSATGTDAVAQAITLRKGSTENWNAPTTTTGSTAATTSAFSATGGSLTFASGAFVLVQTALSDLRTATSESLTASGVTFAGLTEQADANSAPGHDVSLQTYTASVTTGATAAPTISSTLNASSDGGARWVVQTSSPSGPPVGSGSGSFSFVGTASGKRAPKASGSGAWSFVGTASGKRVAKGTGGGAWNFLGTGSGRKPAKGSGSGAWLFSGIGSGRQPPPHGAGIGAWSFVGTGSGKRTPKTTASGTWSFVGTGSGKRVSRGVGAGVWTFAGSGSGNEGRPNPVFAWDGTILLATSAMKWTGTAWVRAPVETVG